jgi:SPP1 gp7 family putative phage head morphogenesis protein
VIDDDAFGLKSPQNKLTGLQQVPYQAWRFGNDASKVKAFRKWLKSQVDAGILTQVGGISGKPWTADYVDSAYLQGGARAYTDVHAAQLAAESGFYLGGKAQFLRDSFVGITAVKSLEMLYTRSFNELQGVTDWMSQQMSRVLADGFVHGHSPRKIATSLTKTISNINRKRALTLARTEIVRAFAEGQLDAFEKLGVKEVGIRAEWVTAGDGKVCDMCGEMEGVILKVEEARGLIPRHPNCRCAWVPADKKRKTIGQIWSKSGKRKALKKSVRAETPSAKNLRTAKNRSVWAGKELF